MSRYRLISFEVVRLLFEVAQKFLFRSFGFTTRLRLSQANSDKHSGIMGGAKSIAYALLLPANIRFQVPDRSDYNAIRPQNQNI